MVSVWHLVPIVLGVVGAIAAARVTRGRRGLNYDPGRAVYAELCANLRALAGAPEAGGVSEAAWERHETLFRRAPELHEPIERTYAAMREPRSGEWLARAVKQGLPAAGVAAGMSERDVELSIACLLLGGVPGDLPDGRPLDV